MIDRSKSRRLRLNVNRTAMFSYSVD